MAATKKSTDTPCLPAPSFGRRLKAGGILGVLSGAGVFLLISLLPCAAAKLWAGAFEAADTPDGSAFTMADLGSFPLMAAAFVGVVVFLKELID